ncbi:cupin domain-containing protein [Nesterenkonia haasae]|uniref:cupin domain-containing protein n=1 Tax=Nesterenkonia haasae TaxID=2587813 RepID=UPI001291D0BB|nr:cupin domain-containing protein [Nesterenkonia haasae]NDK32422.1 cupin domain-containing protein [Nesterenkonia haasae]
MSDSTTAIPTVQIDNEQVRVTEWRFPPGAQTLLHSHEMDYIVVPLTGGTLEVRAQGEVTENILTAGASYFRRAGATHNVINVSEMECAFVEIELKPT